MRMKFLNAIQTKICFGLAVAATASCQMSYQNQSDKATSTAKPSTPTMIVSTSSTNSAPFSLKVGSIYTLSVGLVSSNPDVPISSLKFKTTGANSLGTLPAGWSWTGSSSLNTDASQFSNVGVGSGSQIFLTFSPTSTSQSGVLSLDLLSSSGDVVQTLTYPYQATTDNNIIATTNAPVQVVGSSSLGVQSVVVSFLSDSTTPITNFSIPSLTLPAGWTSPSSSLSCPTVTNTCFLVLNYDPSSAASSGIVTITGTGTSSSSAAKQLTVNIPYVNASGSNSMLVPIVNSGKPSVIGTSGTTQVVPITFKTSGATPVTSVTLSGNLPAGWTTLSGASTVSAVASQVSSAGTNTFVLDLLYSPSASTSGLQTFALTATGNNGVSGGTTSAVNISYGSTSANSSNVLYASSSLGNVGSTAAGQQQIQISFFTDTGQLATGVTLNSSDVATLSAQGITISPSPLVCQGVTSVPCTATLQYDSSANPYFTGAASLRYSYYDQNSVSKDGAAFFYFSPAVQTQVMANVSTGFPVKGIFDVTAPGTNATTMAIGFATNQGIGSLENVSATLPGGWSLSSAPTLPCSIGTTPACVVTYTYQPTALTSQTSFNFNYTYSLDGTAATRVSTSLPVTYLSTPPNQPTMPNLFPFRYFTAADGALNQIKKCRIDELGHTVISTDCSIAIDMTTSALSPPAISTNTYQSIHIVDFSKNGVSKKFFYAIQTGSPQHMVRCQMYATTNPSNSNYGNFDPATCTYSFLADNAVNGIIPALGITRTQNGNTYLYYSDPHNTTKVGRCQLDSDPSSSTVGNAINCIYLTNPLVDHPYAFDFAYDPVTNNATRIYISRYNTASRIFTCALDSDGSVSDSSVSCSSLLGMSYLPTSPSNLATAQKAYGLRIKFDSTTSKNYAFISSIGASTPDGYVYRCEVQSDGTFGATQTAVDANCTGVRHSQNGVTAGLYPTDLQLYSNTNYIYIANDNNAFAPTICRIDYTSAGGVTDCTSIDPAHPYPGNPFTTTSMY